MAKTGRGSTLNRILKNWRKRLLRELHVALPGYITAYDTDTRLADIQLTIKPEINDEFVDPPLLFNVPVRQYNSQKVLFYAPPSENDPVDVIFTDFSLDEYQQEDGKKLIEPEDTQKHSINNAYAVLQGQTAKNRHTIADPTLPGIYLQDDAKLFLGRLGGGGEEVLNLLYQTASALGDLTDYIQNTILFTDTGGDVSGPPDNATLLNPLVTSLNAIKTSLESLGDIDI